jgi:hypothetical protein
MNYIQVKLKQGTKTTTTWVEEKFAKKGKRVLTNPNTEKEEEWEVEEVYGSISKTKEEIRSFERAHLKWRGVTDA